ncbi:MAG: hypothetical protein ACOCRO_02725 [Halanaerobiales bacterium]
MDRKKIYDQELEKLQKIFENVEETKADLVQGLISDAAFLKVENDFLKQSMRRTGMVKIHPDYPEMQKPTEAAKQYLKNANTYSTVIKTLNSILNKSVLEEDDAFDEFINHWKKKKEAN